MYVKCGSVSLVIIFVDKGLDIRVFKDFEIN